MLPPRQLGISESFHASIRRLISLVDHAFCWDVEGLLDAHPEVNFDEVRQDVSEFAAATSMSDLIEDFERLLKRRKSKQPIARPPRPK